MNGELQELATAARVHANNLTADIRNARTRIEHNRLTILAGEADRLAEQLERLTTASL